MRVIVIPTIPGTAPFRLRHCLSRRQVENVFHDALTVERMICGIRFHLCHATPSDPLFGYLERDAPGWTREIESTFSDVIAVGHTHIPFTRSFQLEHLVNPGSLGAFGMSAPEASYAIWEDGLLQLKRYPYSFETTMAEIRTMPVSSSFQDQFIALITTGDLMVGKA